MIIYNCIPFEATQGHVMVIIMSYFKVKCLEFKILSRNDLEIEYFYAENDDRKTPEQRGTD